jgi:hypothetical protein
VEAAVTYKMSDDERATIDWLNSQEGLCWSRRNYRQSSYAKRMFSLKDDLDFDVEAMIASQEWKSWGHVDWKGEYHPGQRKGWEHGVYELPEDEVPVVEETPLVTATAEGGVQVTVTPEIRARWQEAIIADAMEAFASIEGYDITLTTTIDSCNEQIEAYRQAFEAAQGSIRVLGENIHELHEFQAGLPWSIGTPFRHGGLIRPVSFGFRPDPAYLVWYDEAWSSDADGLPAEELGDDPGVAD